MGSSLIGSTLGRFRVDRLLGRGGMGAVYAAFDEKLERDVALKVLNDEGDATVQRKRLLREARLAAKLQHPNIATVYEVDEIEGRLVIVMEMLEGSALRKILTQRKVDVNEALAIARDVARALGRAHSAGVIHRDIKPENIFVTTPSPDSILTKVLDFGLARQRPAGAKNLDETTSTNTTRGDMWGTPGYVSPEQAQERPVDVRTDIFSFGVVFYEMLAGIKPFRGENAVAAMLATVKQEPRPLREIFPAIPIEIDEIVRRCMKKEREERFPDGIVLSAALEGYVRGPTPSARTSNVFGSSPSLPFVPLGDATIAEPAGEYLADHAPTTGGSAAIELAAAEAEGPPSLEQQRVDHMKIVASIGGGVAVALVVVIALLSWSTPSHRRVSAKTTASASSTMALAVSAPPSPAPPDPAASAALPPDDPAASPAPGTPESGPAAVATATAPRPAHLGTAPAVGSAKKKKPADCVQPFTYDKGVKIPKLHCL